MYADYGASGVARGADTLGLGPWGAITHLTVQYIENFLSRN